MLHCRRLRPLAWVLLGLLALAPTALGQEEGPLVLVVGTPLADKFSGPLARMEEAVRAGQPNARFESLRLQGTDDLAAVAARISERRPAVVVTVGMAVTKAVMEQVRDVPVVFTMTIVLDLDALDRERRGSAPNVTGVSIAVPPREQFRVMKEAIPGLKKLGTIYTPDRTDALVEAATRDARAEGIELMARPVRELTQVGEALNAVLGESDAYWVLPDPNATQSSALEEARMRGLVLKKPTVGFDPEYSRRGGHLSIYCDRDDAGAQSGLVVLDILRGKAPADLPLQPARRVLYSFNEDTARQIGLAVSDPFRANAEHVFRNQ